MRPYTVHLICKGQAASGLGQAAKNLVEILLQELRNLLTGQAPKGQRGRAEILPLVLLEKPGELDREPEGKLS